MVVPQAAFGAVAAPSKPSVLKRPGKQAPLTEHEHVLHTLNRFTFGPRPGDVAAVEKMGLQRWFMQQLQPEKIDDSAFEQRMNQFPAMRLSQAELLQRFPSQAMVRIADRRDVQVPIARDRAVRAVFADAKFEYDERQNAKTVGDGAAGAKPQAANAMPQNGMQASMQMAGGSSMDAGLSGSAQASQGSQMLSNGASASAPVELNKRGKAKAKQLAEPLPADDVQAVLAMPPEQRLERLVAMRPEEMFAFKSALKPVQKLLLVEGMTPQDQEIAESFVTAPERVVGAEILEERIERDVFSERQLQAVMTDFWLNHFSVYLRKNENEPYYLPAFEREAILPNALGKFENLLVAVAQSPAMLMYLDNWQSVGPHSEQAEKSERAQMFRPANKQRPVGINENYGRELMELHTLGVNGGYTQQDVIEVAKCFTGWTIDKPYQGGWGQATFDENKHEPGTKTVLGHKIKENGQKEGLEVLHILATSPATAHFVSEKLAVRFVSDDPPPALVNRMAATFLKTEGNIRLVLLTMFRSPEFWSPQVYRAKVKTPIEFMASALRASGADVKTPLPLVQAMDRLGMPIYGMQTPQGYSWKSEDWVSSNALISRMNFALVLSGNRVPGVKTDWPALLGSADSADAVTPGVETENKLEIALLGAPASDRTRSTVLAMFGDPTAQQSAEEAFRAKPLAGESAMVPAAGLMRARAARGPQPGPGSPLDTMAGLLLGSPEFQRR
jgi:uncharacterized protein (DUF1800 family)